MAERRTGDNSIELAQKGQRVADAVKQAIDFHRKGKLGHAEQIYTQILGQLPEQVESLHFLGVLRHQMGQSDEAIELIGRAVALRPDYVDAFNNLANIYKELGATEEAERAFLHIVGLRPDHADTWNNLGVVYAGRNDDDAIDCYQNALKLNVEHVDAWYNLGNAFRRQQKFDDAVGAYERSIKLGPDRGEVTMNLAQALHLAGRTDEATAVLRQWLMRDPDSPIAQHMMAAVTGENIPSRGSDEFVRATFDDFAGSFDAVLKGLDYRAPYHVADALAEVCQADGTLAVLDAGCGTGLCGPLVRPYAERLVGIDLSGKMLERARRRGGYDELHEAELVAYLRSKPGAWDVVISADTLCYFGALEEVMQAAAAALKDGGYLVYTLEQEQASVSEGYRLNPHGRYAHREAYVLSTMRQAGLSCTALGHEVLRKEADKPVHGLVVTARRE